MNHSYNGAITGNRHIDKALYMVVSIGLLLLGYSSYKTDAPWYTHALGTCCLLVGMVVLVLMVMDTVLRRRW